MCKKAKHMMVVWKEGWLDVACFSVHSDVWSTPTWAGQWGDQTAALTVSRKAALLVQLTAVCWANLKGARRLPT